MSVPSPSLAAPTAPESTSGEAPSPSALPLTREAIRAADRRWLGLLLLTAILVLLETLVTFRTSALEAIQTERLGGEFRLNREFAQLGGMLREAETNQMAYVVSGRSDQAERFQVLQHDLAVRIRGLRSPATFAPRRRQALQRFQNVSQTYLTGLERAMVLRRSGQSAAAFAQLEKDMALAQPVHTVLATLWQDSSDALAQREQDLSREQLWLQAMGALRAVGFVTLLLGGYLLLRWDRRLQASREKVLRSANTKLASLAEEDGLTGLKNRRAFDERLIAEWRRARRHNLPLSVLLIDVDHFKRFNDAYGHTVGDDVLRTMAQALAMTARISDTVARYGGEEFVILLPHAEAREAVLVGERLRSVLARTQWPGRPITASIGAATLTAEMKDEEDFLNAADKALYTAKSQGRDRVIHYQELRA